MVTDVLCDFLRTNGGFFYDFEQMINYIYYVYQTNILWYN